MTELEKEFKWVRGIGDLALVNIQKQLKFLIIGINNFEVK